MRVVAAFLSSIFLFSLPVMAAESGDEAVRDAVRALVPDATQISVKPSPIAGISEVAIGTQVLYASADGQFVLGGPLLEVSSGANLTEQRQAVARASLLSKRSDVQPFDWPADDARHTLTVVTDIDCPYCRKLHKEIPALNAAGVSVQYVMLPRAGRDTPSYNKTVGAACAADAEAAITNAMLGATYERGSCDNPIDRHMALARELGVTSTPMIVLPDGVMAPGYKSASALLKLLEK
ncbi:MAG: DsbC family protein [Gammaproteobacteria bacterium]